MPILANKDINNIKGIERKRFPEYMNIIRKQNMPTTLIPILVFVAALLYLISSDIGNVFSCSMFLFSASLILLFPRYWLAMPTPIKEAI
jgi:ascorbate-specific PTS system EIIC-type component UlaA